jgi:glycosyltransferase involved in cell wall biosynthesis
MAFDILHTTISPCDNERRIFNEAISAGKQGYRVEIIALKTPELPASSELNGIPLERISIKRWQSGPLKFLVFNFKLFRRLLGQDFRILHCHDLWVLPASAAAACWKRCRLVYDAHEYYRGLEIFLRKKITGCIWAITEWIFIKKVDVLITINRFHAELFRNCYPSLAHRDILYNYPSLEAMALTEKLPVFRERESKVIFQGILKAGRALPEVIESMEAVIDGRLEFLGHGEIETELQQLTVSKNLQDRVIFRGKMDWNKLLPETQKARAGLVLFQPRSQNYAYAMPNKFFEYVLTGTPVIASNIATFKDLNAEFEVALLISPDSIQDISKAITLLLTNEDQWSRLHQNCLQARKKWNWEVQEKVLIDIYHDLLKAD